MNKHVQETIFARQLETGKQDFKTTLRETSANLFKSVHMLAADLFLFFQMSVLLYFDDGLGLAVVVTVVVVNIKDINLVIVVAIAIVARIVVKHQSGMVSVMLLAKIARYGTDMATN